MGYDISLVDRKTRETLLLKNAFYKRGSNVRANVDANGNLHQIPEQEAYLSITYNYSGYYYEATDGDERFWDEDKENRGLNGLNGKTAAESIKMLTDMLERIRSKYLVDGEWTSGDRIKYKYFDEKGNEIDPIYAITHHIPKTEVEEHYTVSEGDTSNYWEETAANAMNSLQQLLYMAVECSTLDCVWEVC